ncbi:MAG: LysM peptidoglycan-binding domain-containing protein [Actinomycetes bacterium]
MTTNQHALDPTTEHHPSRLRALGTITLWLLLLAAALVALRTSWRVIEPEVAWRQWASWKRWASQHRPEEVTAVVLTPLVAAAGLVLGGYAFAAASIIAVTERRPDLQHLRTRVPGFVLALATSLLALAGPAGAASDPGASPRVGWERRPLVELRDGGARSTTSSLTTTTSTLAPLIDRRPATSTTIPATGQRRLDESGAGLGRPTDPATGAPTTTPARPEPGTLVPDAPSAMVTVRSGDNFWSIARSELERRGHENATGAEIARYWQRLIERNRSRLANPGNPNLITPGQVFELPD